MNSATNYFSKLMPMSAKDKQYLESHFTLKKAGG